MDLHNLKFKGGILFVDGTESINMLIMHEISFVGFYSMNLLRWIAKGQDVSLQNALSSS